MLKPFTEQLRYEYNLTPDSCVMDVGGYEGNWAFEINRKYGCHVWIFEPATRFYDKLVERFKGNPKIVVMNAAIGAEHRIDLIRVNGDSTGLFQEEGDEEHVIVMSISGALSLCPHWSVVKLNCEGGEFEIMESVLGLNLARLADNWQMQFHNIVPNAVMRYSDIRDGLERTHQLTYDAPWCWCNYDIKT